jgi:hypothetical protein
VAGKPSESPLCQHISSTDEDEVMPPPKSKKKLSADQKELIRKWIEQGAVWQPHWSFMKPERPAAPQVKNAGWARNPIDRFILARLEREGFEPAPEADRRTLARRLALDLTGLPPEPADVEAFVADQSKDYYEKYIDKLMAMPQWGEHRARYWLDAARYADTHGLHFDNYREMWPYRDWVINAFNRNEHFDQFTIEQLAGDLLKNPTMDQTIATGFHRCAITTNEGGTIAEENLANYARERVETTGWVFLGLTSNCCVCHDHKFDPLTMKDFYSMSAFFRNTTQGALDGNVPNSTPSIQVPQAADRPRWEALPGQIAAAKQRSEQRKKDAAADFDKWATTTGSAELEKAVNPAGLAIHAALNEGAGDQVTVLTASNPLKISSAAPLAWKPGGKLGAAPVLKAPAAIDLGNVGDFELNQPFSYGCWVNVPKGFNGWGAVFARMESGNGYRGWDLFCNQGVEFATHLIDNWPDNAIKMRTKSRAVKQGTWQHLFVTYDGSARPEAFKIFVDGAEQPIEVEHNTIKPKSSIRNTLLLKLAQRNTTDRLDGVMIQDVRIYTRILDAGEIKSLARGSHLRAILALTPQKRSAEQRQQLFDYYLASKDTAYQQATAVVAALDQELAAIKQRSPVTHIQQERMDSMPTANILFRGQYDQPKEKVGPAVFASLHPMPEGAPKNRMGLAQWIVSPENPLTARVTVNRFWQEVFGVGIVKTAEDFGIMGDPPSNVQLLDWLAVEFRESGWDVKHMFRLMVTSAAYRQSAAATAMKLEKDPANRWLSRGPRFRMDAEMVRDYALFASGTLGKKIGGASVRPYQPDGVWEAVAMPESNTHYYKRDSGEALYRRSLYTFWKRAAPPASMDVFNAPSRETACVRRERTNTPLQALVTLNDPQFVEAARNLAQLALRENKADHDKAIDFIARRLLARPLRPQESAVVKATYADLIAFYQARPEDAKKLITFGESRPDAAIAPAELAAWTMVANQLMNLDEVLNK